MSCYNLVVYDYLGHRQIRIYNRPIRRQDNESEKVEIETNEQIINDYNKGDGNVKDKPDVVEAENSHSTERSIYNSLKRTKQTIFEYGYANEWDWFGTLTFSPDKINRYDYEEITKRTSQFLKRVRNKYADGLRYMYIPEQHANGAWHIHILLANCGDMQFEDSGRLASGKRAMLRNKSNEHLPTIYNLEHWKYGFSSFTRVVSSDKCVSYISKYVTKDLTVVAKNKRRVFPSYNCKRADVTYYNLPQEEITEVLAYYAENDMIDYCKTQTISEANLSVQYYEIKGDIENDE